jgi:tetratricopeptide (TPR) repeat protein
MTYFRTLLTCIFVCIGSALLTAQTSQISRSDSIISELQKKNHDTVRINLLNKLTELTAGSNPDSSILLSNQALQLAKNNVASGNKNTAFVFNKAIATAQANLGMLHANKGNYDKALKYLDSAFAMAKENRDFENYISVLNNYGQTYLQKGDLPKAKEYIENTIKVCDILKRKDKKAAPLNNLGVYYIYMSDVDNSIKIFKQLKENLKQSNNKQEYGLALNNLGFIYYNYKNLADTAILYFKEALDVFQSINDLKNLSSGLINLGVIYDDKADFVNSSKVYYRALELLEKQGDSDMLGTVLNNLGNVYAELGDREKSMVYFKKSLAVATRMNDQNRLLALNNNIASVYKNAGKYDLALAKFQEALKYSHKLNDFKAQISIVGNIGNLYHVTKQPELAKKYYYESLEIAEKNNLLMHSSVTLNNLGTLLSEEGNLKESAEIYKKSLEISLKQAHIKNQKYAFHGLFIISKKQGNFKDALEYHEKYLQLTDSIFNIDSKKESLKRESQYEYSQKEALLKAEQEKKNLIAKEESKRQRTTITLISIGLLIVLALAIVIFRSLQQNKKANKIISAQKLEVEKQKDVAEEQRKIAEHQKHLVEEHQKEIIDSITYAKRLQQAILPPMEYISRYFNNTFVLYLPKDIVAGDFYWMEHIDDISFIAAADSTGHGVPGAMVSVVCSNALNRATLEFGMREPGKILDKATDIVLETFAKSGEEIKDGMDISLLAYNHTTGNLYWSGANNPLWYLTPSKELEEITATKQPVGKSDHRKPFETHQIQYQKGSTFYLMTDGYPDQFGGPKGKKFKYKQLEDLIVNTSNLSLNDQKEILAAKFDEWKGDLEQVDDVTILAIKL